MSFNTEVKNELARITPTRRDCQMAELSAIIHLDGSMSIHGPEMFSFNTISENAAVARKTYTLLHDLFDITAEIRVWDKQKLQKGHNYEINIAQQKGIAQVLNELCILDDHMQLDYGIAPRLTRRSCCAIAYLRGAFLASGAVTDPKKGYHFEITVTSRRFGEDIQSLFERFSIRPRISERKKNLAVYLKESESIVQFLALVGAHQTLFRWVDAKLLREVRNEVNRIINCETANLQRTVEAAQKQINDINLIEEVLGLDRLPQALWQIADLRLRYPEANLKELGEEANPKITKSAVNHRLRRIQSIADSIRIGQ